MGTVWLTVETVGLGQIEGGDHMARVVAKGHDLALGDDPPRL